MRHARWSPGWSLAVLAALAAGASAAAQEQGEQTRVTVPPPPVSAMPSPEVSASPRAALQGPLVVLDHVVAVVHGEVILESDVQEEMRIASLQPIREDVSTNTPQAALSRLIDRNLILNQMKSGPALAQPTDQQVDEQLAELRKQIPDCVAYHCETEAGWRALLAAHGLTEEEIRARWRQRIAILSFIQSRFGAGVRVAQPEIEQYYKEEFAPEFAKKGLRAPLLSAVSARIQEVLLQQKVNSLLQDWLQSLKDDGSVTILSPQDVQADPGSTGDPDTGAQR